MSRPDPYDPATGWLRRDSTIDSYRRDAHWPRNDPDRRGGDCCGWAVILLFALAMVAVANLLPDLPPP